MDKELAKLFGVNLFQLKLVKEIDEIDDVLYDKTTSDVDKQIYQIKKDTLLKVRTQYNNYLKDKENFDL